MAESLYRKYRPQVFDDIVGQDHIVRTLKNALANNKVSHAYLFTGPRGTGKTTTARILAKALLCEQGPSDHPDGTCEECKLIAESAHPDVSELDAASRTGVENVRDEIISRVNYAPVRGQYKVYIIDEVHMLSVAAFNALLKTLEEPPEHVVFILCTTDPQKVPETIHSRCQRFDFRPINFDELTGRLGAVCNMENVEFEGEALDLIARRSNGGLRDALTALEQVIAYGEGKVTTEIAERMLGRVEVNDMNDLTAAIAQSNLSRGLEFVDRYVEDGVDLAQFIDDLAMRMRNIYVVKLVGCDVALDVSAAELEQIKAEANDFTKERLEYILTLLREESPALKRSSNQRLSFELTLFKLMNPESVLTLESLNARLAKLECGAPMAEVCSKPSGNSASPAPEARSKGTGTEPQSRHSEQREESTTVQAKETELPLDEVSSKPAGTDVSRPPVSSKPQQSERATATAAPVAAAKGGKWSQALEILHEKNPNVASLVDNTVATYGNNVVTIKLAPGKEFTRRNLSNPASKNAIISALEAVGILGASVEVVVDDSIKDTTNFAPVATPTVKTIPPLAEASSKPAGTEEPALRHSEEPNSEESTTAHAQQNDILAAEASSKQTGNDMSHPPASFATSSSAPQADVPQAHPIDPSAASKPQQSDGDTEPAPADDGPIPEPYAGDVHEEDDEDLARFNSILSDAFGEDLEFKEVE